MGRSLRRSCGILIGLILVGGAVWSLWTGLSFAVFVVLAVLLVGEVFSTYETSLLGAARRQRAVAVWRVVESCARPGLGLLAVLVLGVTPTALLAGYAVATAGIVLVYQLARQRELVRSDPEETVARQALADEIRCYSRPLVPSGILDWVTALADRYLLGEWAGPEQVGIYAATYGLVSRPFLMGSGILLQALRPVYYDAIARGDRSVEKQALRLWIGATAGMCLAGVLGVFFLREYVSEWLLGSRYRSGTAIMPMLAVGFSLMVLSHVFNTISLARKKPNHVLWSEGAAALGTIAFGIPLIASLHLWGAAMATAAAYAVQALLAICLAGRVSRGNPAGGDGR